MIVDDHEIVRRGIAEIVDRDESLEVVAEAGSVADAVRRADLVRPDVILVDLQLPDGTGIELMRELRELEADGMVHRELYHQVPPKTEYSLTQRGVSFVPVLNAMCAWGKDVLDEVGKPSPETSEVLAG